MFSGLRLVNWEIVNYVYDVLGEQDQQCLENGSNEYGIGSWASSLRYQNGVYYVVFSHPELTKEAPDEPANFGHLDQQFATQWVKENIAAFGGDPDKITIGGQSAGGGSVLSQLTSPQNHGLF